MIRLILDISLLKLIRLTLTFEQQRNHKSQNIQKTQVDEVRRDFVEDCEVEDAQWLVEHRLKLADEIDVRRCEVLLFEGRLYAALALAVARSDSLQHLVVLPVMLHKLIQGRVALGCSRKHLRLSLEGVARYSVHLCREAQELSKRPVPELEVLLQVLHEQVGERVAHAGLGQDAHEEVARVLERSLVLGQEVADVVVRKDQAVQAEGQGQSHCAEDQEGPLLSRVGLAALSEALEEEDSAEDEEDEGEGDEHGRGDVGEAFDRHEVVEEIDDSVHDVADVVVGQVEPLYYPIFTNKRINSIKSIFSHLSNHHFFIS